MIVRPFYTIYMEEAGEAGSSTGGASSEADLNVDIAAVSDSISMNDLGLGGDPVEPDDKAEPRTDDPAKPALSPAEKEAAASAATKAGVEAKARVELAAKVAKAKTDLVAKKVDLTGKTDEEILKLATPELKAAPKAWKKEMAASWEKVAKELPEVAAYVEQREAEVEAGFRQYAEKTKYGESMAASIAPYEPLLQAQGVKDHGLAIRTLMNSHYVMSTQAPETKADYAVKLMQNYGVTMEMLTAAVARGGTQAEETAPMRELRLRTERLENERRQEISGKLEAVKAASKAEVEAFAADPKHPYFEEVAKEMTLMLQDPNISMEAAYEAAVWANPLTRAKENERIRKDAELAAKKSADEAAAAATKARGLKVDGDQRHRESPDIMGTMDETLRETMSKIKDRQEA